MSPRDPLGLTTQDNLPCRRSVSGTGTTPQTSLGCLRGTHRTLPLLGRVSSPNGPPETVVVGSVDRHLLVLITTSRTSLESVVCLLVYLLYTREVCNLIITRNSSFLRVCV